MLKKLFASVCLTLALCTPSFAGLVFANGNDVGYKPVYTVKWGIPDPCIGGETDVDVSVNAWASVPPLPGTQCDLYVSINGGGSYIPSGNAHAMGTGMTTWTGLWCYSATCPPAAGPTIRMVVKGTFPCGPTTGVEIVDPPSSDSLALVDWTLTYPAGCGCSNTAYMYYNVQTPSGTTATTLVLEFWDTVLCPNSWVQSGSGISLSPYTVKQGFFGCAVPNGNTLFRFRMLDACGSDVVTPVQFTVNN